ncbi:ABC transporter permease [Novosphingopyxis sp.]|uniref:ABC transporter permease n=1 Tax=Novosphingopyxis sp. TaxID=2709690 RepID=UPI003B5A48F4
MSPRRLSIGSALDSLRSNSFRSGLTILGLAIGVAAITLIGAIGNGLGGLVHDQLERYDASLLIVTPTDTAAAGRVPFRLRARDTDYLKANVPTVMLAGGEVRQPVRARANGETVRTSLSGLDSDMFDLRRMAIAGGRSFTQAEYRSGARVALVGNTVLQKLFAGGASVGQVIRVNGVVLTIVGMLEEEAAGIGGDPDDIIVVPLRTAQRRIAGQDDQAFDRVDSIWVTFAGGDPARNRQAVLSTLTRRSGKQAEDISPVDIRSMEEQLEQVRQAVGAVRIGMSLIASIAIFVAGIGVLNTMLASIGERTREIGIRRALGATVNDIRNQFMIEAVVISVIGGVVGVLVALVGIGIASAQLPDWPLSVTVVNLCGVVAIAITTGVFFGIIPAIRASRLSPTDALRSF